MRSIGSRLRVTGFAFAVLLSLARADPAVAQQLDPQTLCADASNTFQVVNTFYDASNSPVHLYCGTTNWGYLHIKSRYNSTFVQQMSATIHTGDFCYQGTAVVFAKVYGSNLFKVVVEYGKKSYYPKPQQITTAYLGSPPTC